MSTDASRAVIVPAFRASNAYRYYVLTALSLVGACAWIDRQIFSIVLQSIKQDFALTDTQLGLVGGLAFGLFYVTMGVPVAWLADRFSRRSIIAGSIAIWSVVTALTGLATGFWSLFLARVGVGIGEAGAAAPSQSMLSDYFEPERRGLAMGLLYVYVPIGYLVSYGLGGWVNDQIGWRMAFILFGLPGVALALLVRLTVREPPRGYSEAATAPTPTQAKPGIFEAIGYVLRRPTLRRLPIAGAAHAIGMVSAGVWMPAFFMRAHHMTSTQIGFSLALILGVGGLIGALAGGHLADRIVARTGDERWYALLCALSVLGTIPFTLATYLVNDARLALLIFVIPSVLNHIILGPIFATVQNLAGVARRAIAAACYLFLVNLVAMGVGPTLVGVLSDAFEARLGSDALRYSLLVLITVASLIAGVYFLLAARTLRADLAHARLPPST